MDRSTTSNNNANNHTNSDTDNPTKLTALDRKLEEEALARLAAIVESSDDAIISKTLDGTITSWNKSAERMYGYSAEEIIRRPIHILVPRDRPDEVRRILESIRRGECIEHYETVRVRKDGRRVDVSLTVSPVRDKSGNIIGASSIARDITERKRVEEALQESERRLFQFLEVMPVGVFVIDSSGRPYYANQKAQEILGKGADPRSAADRLSETYQAYVAGTTEEYPAERMPVVRALAGEKSTIADMEIHRPDKIIPIEVTAAPIYDAQGRIVYAIATFTDITERRRSEKILRERAIRDELTGLYNRGEMEYLLKREVERCRRYGHYAALIILDVDHFKSINDTHGHLAGDEVLRQIAHLIKGNVRTIDQATRYGGEEMAVILPETTESGALKVAERIRQAVAGHSFTFEKLSKYLLPLRVTISLGVASFPVDANSEVALIAAADKALYEAKKQGRNRTVLFSKNTLKTAPLSQSEG